jgi:hypothetical protein
MPGMPNNPGNGMIPMMPGMDPNMMGQLQEQMQMAATMYGFNSVEEFMAAQQNMFMSMMMGAGAGGPPGMPMQMQMPFPPGVNMPFPGPGFHG